MIDHRFENEDEDEGDVDNDDNENDRSRGRLGHVLLAYDEWIKDARTVSNTNDEKRKRDWGEQIDERERKHSARGGVGAREARLGRDRTRDF